MIYEHRSQPLLPRKQFLIRLLNHTGISFGLLLSSLAIGLLGYRLLERFIWIDAILNASMILGGMGPVNTLETVPGEIFASLYALFSGVIFLVGAGVFFTPVVHRIIHQLNLEED
ncbi:MAG: hypothetical protein MUO54_07240 [Anaerolineales bacterium]|nr:hypothetical protein [Anaerolineales bacterium]